MMRFVERERYALVFPERPSFESARSPGGIMNFERLEVAFVSREFASSSEEISTQ